MLYTIVKSPYGYSKFCNIDTHEKNEYTVWRFLPYCMVITTLHTWSLSEYVYRNLPDGHEWISLNSMGKIAKGVNKINFAMLYGNYCYIFIENFSPCVLTKRYIVPKILFFLPLTECINIVPTLYCSKNIIFCTVNWMY